MKYFVLCVCIAHTQDDGSYSQELSFPPPVYGDRYEVFIRQLLGNADTDKL
jgi:hypothetical protein